MKLTTAIGYAAGAMLVLFLVLMLVGATGQACFGAGLVCVACALAWGIRQDINT